VKEEFPYFLAEEAINSIDAPCHKEFLLQKGDQPPSTTIRVEEAERN
jgi:hypothetical protein